MYCISLGSCPTITISNIGNSSVTFCSHSCFRQWSWQSPISWAKPKLAKSPCAHCIPTRLCPITLALWFYSLLWILCFSCERHAKYTLANMRSKRLSMIISGAKRVWIRKFIIVMSFEKVSLNRFGRKFRLGLMEALTLLRIRFLFCLWEKKWGFNWVCI